MATDISEKNKIITVALEELRRVHDHVSNAYDQLRVKALAMIGGEVAIITFILAADDHSKIVVSDIAEKIFLIAGIVALILAFILLLGAVLSSDWPVPGDMNEIELIDNGIDDRYDTLEKFLKFLRKDYLEGNRECMKILERKGRRANWALYLLLAGAILLIVLKYGGKHL